MNKKDVRHLITFPVSMFLILGVSALFFSHLYFTHYYEHEKQDREKDQKFEQLFENVKEGKLQLTTDKWIEMVQANPHCWKQSPLNLVSMQRVEAKILTLPRENPIPT